ncbi:MAG: HAD-IIA family hydrolase [Coriobacteriales bacterium]|jgi:HAD superfamily hydrolase (TIGR01450 family)
MFEQTKAVMFDLDGTIYYGSRIIEGANEAIERCRELGKRVFFLTNNSTKTRAQLYEKLSGMDIDCAFDEVVTSGYVAALYAKREGLGKIYLCGSADLASEFEEVGVSTALASEAENLFIGYDPAFDYAKLTDAVRVALRAKRIIACNKEKVFRGEGAQWFPGCGGMVAPIEWCSGRSSDYVIGKPNTLMLEMLCSQLSITEKEALVVGDTYGSDILMANRFGCPSVLIGTQEYPDTVTIGRIGELVHLLG